MKEVKGPRFQRKTTGAKGVSETLTVTIAAPGKYRFPEWLNRLIDVKDERALREVLDHPRHVGNIAFSEPYGASDKSIGGLILFCQKHTLRFSVIGKSNNYPSETFRIVIWRPQDAEELANLCHWIVPNPGA